MIVPHELPHQLFQLLFPTGQTVINLRAFISASHTLTEKKLGHAVYICFEHGTQQCCKNTCTIGNLFVHLHK